MRTLLFLLFIIILAGTLAVGNIQGQEAAADEDRPAENLTKEHYDMNMSEAFGGDELGEAWGHAFEVTTTVLYNEIAAYSFANPDWTSPQRVFALIQLVLIAWFVKLLIVPVAIVITAVQELRRQQQRGESSD